MESMETSLNKLISTTSKPSDQSNSFTKEAIVNLVLSVANALDFLVTAQPFFCRCWCELWLSIIRNTPTMEISSRRTCFLMRMVASNWQSIWEIVWHNSPRWNSHPCKDSTIYSATRPYVLLDNFRSSRIPSYLAGVLRRGRRGEQLFGESWHLEPGDCCAPHGLGLLSNEGKNWRHISVCITRYRLWTPLISSTKSKKVRTKALPASQRLDLGQYSSISSNSHVVKSHLTECLLIIY